MKSSFFILTIAFLQLACAEPKTNTPLNGIYLNSALDFIQIQSDTLFLASAFSMFPCTLLCEQQGDEIVAKRHPGQQNGQLFSATLIAEERAVPLNIQIDEGRRECLPHGSSMDNIFRLADDSLHPKPWDSLLIEVFIYRSLLYSARIDASAEMHIIHRPANAAHLTASIPVGDSLMREISLIHGAQFALWDGEASHGPPLRISIYRNGKAERYTGYTLPFYYRHLYRFLVELDSLFTVWKQ